MPTASAFISTAVTTSSRFSTALWRPAAGGQIIMPKTLIRDDIGYIGMFCDSEGNIIGLHSMH